MKKEPEGTITVFLSLTFLIILAVVMTTIEAARVNAARAGCERAVAAAMDSVLSEYYSPLYEEYHIFALDGGYGTDTMNTDTMAEKMKDYMEYTFTPDKDINLPGNLSLDYLNLYGVNTNEINVDTPATIMDYEGEAFVSQATAYMKYKVAGDGLESFFSDVTEFEKAENAQPVLEEKQKAEESLYEIDKKVLKLMRLVDGINISEDGVKLDSNEKIGTLDNFVKKICIYSVNKENVKINNDLVYESLKDKYVNPISRASEAEDIIDDLYENVQNIESAKEKYENLLSVDTSSIKDPEQLKKHKKALAKAKKNYQKYKDKQTSLIQSLNNALEDIKDLSKETLSVTEDALDAIDGLIDKQEDVSEVITGYEDTLEENKENLSEDFYEGLLEDLPNMEKYLGGETDSIVGYDFVGMKETLLNNREILKEVKTKANVAVTKEQKSWEGARSTLLSIKSTFAGYSYDKLEFDYSSITKPEESESFFEGVKSLMEDGILYLVMEDVDSISEKTLSGDDLPSSIHGQEESKEAKDITSLFSSIGLGSKNTLSDIFDNFTESFSFTETALQTGDVIGEYLLFQEYLTSNFNSYTWEEGEEDLKALEYELEYILMGKGSDYDNLKAVITKILLIRTVMNLITLISDSKSSKEASLLAAAFVGFTGLPALVEITKMIILTVWSFVESLVDVAALMQGKEVAFMKTGANLEVELYDIVTLSKTMIQSKVAKMPDSSTSFGLGYKDYIELFLYIEGKEKKSYRAMDLIQENLQLKYEDTFFMKNSIIGFQANTNFTMETKFVALPFVAELINDDSTTGYEFNVEKGYAY